MDNNAHLCQTVLYVLFIVVYPCLKSHLRSAALVYEEEMLCNPSLCRGRLQVFGRGHVQFVNKCNVGGIDDNKHLVF